jgi:chemotaxis protein histidine kinase CheA
MSQVNNDYDAILANLEGEFIDEAEDILNEIDVIIGNLNSGQVTPKDGITELFRRAHSLKGSASIARRPSLSLIMHRMEDYLSSITSLVDKNIIDLQTFSDKARDFLSGEAGKASGAELTRVLPAYSGEEEASSGDDSKNISALLVVTDKISAKIFEKEFNKHGLSVIRAASSMEALNLATHAKPDFIVVSGVVDELSGVDIACAIAAMPITKEIPISVMTSFERDHADLDGLPESIPLIQKNNLSDDLETALKQAGLH